MNPYKYGSLRGFDAVVRQLNKEILTITEGSRAGLIRAAKYVRRDMETEIPLIPKRLGDLEKSFAIRNMHEGQNPTNHRKAAKYGIRFGFGVNYAIHVHEIVDAKHWTREGSGPFFFSKALIRNYEIMLQIIAASAKIK